MVNIIATLFRFRQFVFEYAPIFIIAWLGRAVATGVIVTAQRKGFDLPLPSRASFKYRARYWVQWLLSLLLYRPGGKVLTMSTSNWLLLFSVVASVPALMATSLIDMKTLWLRIILAIPYALSLNWLVTSVISHRQSGNGEQEVKTGLEFKARYGQDNNSTLSPWGRRHFARVTWESFKGQVEVAIVPLIIGLSLASALTIFVPAYLTRPWLGEGAWQGPYLAGLLVIPFQLTDGAEVLLASALVVKGASPGTVLSVMLAATGTNYSVIRHLYRPTNFKTMALNLIAAWLVAGTLGVAVDSIQQLFIR